MKKRKETCVKIVVQHFVVVRLSEGGSRSTREWHIVLMVF